MATIIEVNGTNIHYKLEGPQNGPTIVFQTHLEPICAFGTMSFRIYQKT